MKRLLFMILMSAGICTSMVFADGTYSVGSGQTYSTLKAAFDAINSGTITGVINLEIAANTTESAAAVLNSSNGTTVNYSSIKIYPVGGARVVGGSVAGPIIRYAGADNVTIDGSIGGTGSDKSLTIQNTNTGSTASQAIRIDSNADYNTVKNCIIKGVNPSNATDRGIITFTSSNPGNDNNTITNNNITCTSASETDRPAFAVYSVGNSATSNSGNVISNNNFYNLLNSSINNSSVVYIGNYNTDWTISGNSFYETTAVPAATANLIVSFIKVGATTAGLGTSNVAVTGNYIGGTAAQCGGTALTKTAGTNGTELRAIIAEENPGGSISNNTIQNISWANNTNTNISMIYCTARSYNFVVANNTIGGGESQKISYTVNTANNPNLFGVDVESTVTVAEITVSGNYISYLDGNNQSADNALNICGINVLSGVGSFYNNIISLSPASTAKVYGIYESGAVNYNHNLYHNTVYIGGSTSAYPSYALWVNASTNTRDIRNNIFVNERINTAGTAKHYGAYYNAAGGSLTANYNNYYATGADGYAGYYDGADVAKTASVVVTNQDANSTVASPGITPGATAGSYKGTVKLNGTPIASVLKDYADVDRNATTPSIGAFEIESISTTSTILGNDKISIYTEGSKIMINAKNLLNNARVMIYDIKGTIIVDSSINNLSSVIQISQKGLYLIRVKLDDEVYNKKVFVF